MVTMKRTVRSLRHWNLRWVYSNFVFHLFMNNPGRRFIESTLFVVFAWWFFGTELLFILYNFSIEQNLIADCVAVLLTILTIFSTPILTTIFGDGSNEVSDHNIKIKTWTSNNSTRVMRMKLTLPALILPWRRWFHLYLYLNWSSLNSLNFSCKNFNT